MKNSFAAQKETVAEGNSKLWDISLLSNILLTSNGWDTQDLDQSTKALIENVRKARNEFVHVRNTNLQMIEIWDTLYELLIQLDDKEDELHQIKKDFNVGFLNDDNIEEVKAIKEKGNLHYKQGQFELAIESYTRGILSSSRIPLSDRAILHTNRSVAYLALYNSKTPLENKTPKEKEQFKQISQSPNFAELSLEDAEKAIEYQRDWWKGYYRKGLALESLKEYDKALSSFEKAKLLETPTKTAEKALHQLRFKLVQKERQDHLDPIAMPMLFSERLDILHAKTGGIAHSKLIPKMTKILPPAEKAVLMGHQYRDGDIDLQQDYEMAVKYYSKAASLNNPEGIYNLALLYKNGFGVEQNLQVSFNLFKRAAQMNPKFLGHCPNIGVAESQHALGSAYADGLGCNIDLISAAFWYEKASENGSPQAANNLGLLYLTGCGVKGDLVKAEQYLSLSAYRGNTKAMVTLAELLLDENFDFDRAEMYFERAISSGSVLAQTIESDFRDKVIEKRALFLKTVVSWEKSQNLPTNLSYKERYERFKSNIGLPGKEMRNNSINPTSFYLEEIKYSALEKLEILQERAKNQSHYASRMISALESFISSVIALENDIELCLVDLAQCYLLEHSVASLPLKLLEKYRETVDMLLVNSKVNTTFDRNLKICRSILFMQNHEQTTLFLDGCIRDYPNEDFFWNIRGCMKGFMQKYEDGIIDINECIRLNPDRYDYLYDKAVLLRLCDTKPYQKVIEAYQDFIIVSPSDHRKLPESYYAIGMTLLVYNDKDTVKARQYYNMGLEAEKSQFPFYLPYESRSKEMLIRALDKPNSSSFSKSSSSKEEYLSDPLRTEMIVNCRQKISAKVEWQIKIGNSFQHITWKPPKTQTLQPETFVPISLEDMDPTMDRIYDGKFINVTIFERAVSYLPSISLLILDSDYSMQRMYIYGHPREVGLDLVTKAYLPGRKMTIFNPYFRLCNDGKPAIRVDDPSNIVLREISNICAACGMTEANKKCSKCDYAVYCSKECQIFDWKVYKHKLMCQLPAPKQTLNNATVYTLSHSD
ncbi:hypothetical protein HK103_001054 [Boothiomyces macroporosus]|uniref:MYND-type domain-containing protein n=1 Tax=Boothiomyces macroporosus TaxID=261099 RepID=A0AAD5Y591_9FUNG|nr:hypothetical protein HK103_001054 [Boothiomyces macroporosus]